MINTVENLTGLLKSKLGKFLGLLLLVGLVVLLVMSLTKQRSRLSEIPIISLLQSVEKMDRLELMTFNSSELLILGDPNVMQSMIDKAIADSSKKWVELKTLQLNLEKNKIEMQHFEFKQKNILKNVLSLKKKADSCHQQYNLLDKSFSSFFKSIGKQSPDKVSSKYGHSLFDRWSSYLKDSSKEKHYLEKEWLSQRKARHSTWLTWHNAALSEEKAVRFSTHTRQVKYYQKAIASGNKKIEALQLSLKSSISKINNLRKSLVVSEAELGDNFTVKKPKLLAILPTKTSFYLDMNNVKTKITADSLIEIFIDTIHHDPVYVEVDSSKHFNIAQRRLEFANEKNGLYFELFEQLQTGIEVIEVRVKSQLKSDDIKKKALEKAESYFQSIYSPLGYKVNIHYGIAKKSEIGSVRTVEKKTIKLAENHSGKPVKVLVSDKISKAPKTASTTKGIDVSHFNGIIDWSAVANQKIDFAYAKATQGITVIDPKFHQNWLGMKKVKMKRGAYHFYVPTDDPVKQAEHFIATVGELDSNNLPPVLDLEDTDMGGLDKGTYQKNVFIWMNMIEEHFKVKPIIYTYTYYANQYLANDKFSAYKLWIAEYTTASSPIIPTTWQKKGWYMWQFSAKDKLKGIDGHVDYDIKK